ncbi:hypothetical protein [Roseibium sp. M-1]
MNAILPDTIDAAFPLNRAEPIAIHNVLNLFEQGSPELVAHLAPELDFRIDHYKDETDVSWQVAGSLQEIGCVLQRLATEVFPKGTKILGLGSRALGDGWYVTRFKQRFYYPVREAECESLTYILSHETDGKLDFFRETVTTVQPMV